MTSTCLRPLVALKTVSSCTPQALSPQSTQRSDSLDFGSLCVTGGTQMPCSVHAVINSHHNLGLSPEAWECH